MRKSIFKSCRQFQVVMTSIEFSIFWIFNSTNLLRPFYFPKIFNSYLLWNWKYLPIAFPKTWRRKLGTKRTGFHIFFLSLFSFIDQYNTHTQNSTRRRRVENKFISWQWFSLVTPPDSFYPWSSSREYRKNFSMCDSCSR